MHVQDSMSETQSGRSNPRIVTRGSGSLWGKEQDRLQGANLLAFDWYEGTIHGVDENEVVRVLVEGFDLAGWRLAKGMFSYTNGGQVHRGDRVLVNVWWGGTQGVHFSGTGENGRQVAKIVKFHYPRHAVTRADVKIDWVISGLFDELSALLLRNAKEQGLSVDQQGDWLNGKARTLYLGAKSSAVRLVLYEKGYECGGDKAWTRLEVRVRPQKESKWYVADWNEGDYLRASKWLTEALVAIGFEKVQVEAVGTVYRPTDHDRAWAALLKQYGPTLKEHATRLGGWAELAKALEAKLGSIVTT